MTVEKESTNCTDLERVSENHDFVCEVKGCKNHAVLICGFCGLRVCSSCMHEKPTRACCHTELKGIWE